ncbi:hypothetical protein BV20DRAFT_974180 [Pilatotrama ljubarskyi]|nr:hypothetical protein BV20DRAFT_974180 [Pilatotrama ljubarskyi]
MAAHPPRISPESRALRVRSTAPLPVHNTEDPVPDGVVSNKRKKGKARWAPALLRKLPPELFTEIVRYLHPRDLLSLLFVNKSVHDWLHDVGQRSLWRYVVRNATDLPPCPEHMCELRYVRLVFGRHCMACGANQAKLAYYMIGWRFCRACREVNIWTEEQALQYYSSMLDDFPILKQPPPAPFTSLTRVLWEECMTPYHQPYNLCYRAELEQYTDCYMRIIADALQQKHSKELLKVILETRDAFVDRQIQFSEAAQDWESTQYTEEYVQRGDRISEALRRLTAEHGYSKEDLPPYSPQGTAKPEWHKLIIRAGKVLTDKAWSKLSPKLLQIIHEEKLRREQEAEENRVKARMDLLLELYEEALVPSLTRVAIRDRMPYEQEVRGLQIPALLEIAASPGAADAKDQLSSALIAVAPDVLKICLGYRARLDQHLYHALAQHLSRVAPSLLATGPAPGPDITLYAASIFACEEFGQLTGIHSDEVFRPVFLSFAQVHQHWRQEHPRSTLGLSLSSPSANLKERPKTPAESKSEDDNDDRVDVHQEYEEDETGAVTTSDSQGKAESKPQVKVYPSRASLDHIRALGLREDVTMAEMDLLVQSGRLICSCRLSRHFSDWTWCDLLRHTIMESCRNHDTACPCKASCKPRPFPTSVSEYCRLEQQSVPDDHARLIIVPEGQPIPAYEPIPQAFLDDITARVQELSCWDGMPVRCNLCAREWRKVTGTRSAAVGWTCCLPQDPFRIAHHLRDKHGKIVLHKNDLQER